MTDRDNRPPSDDVASEPAAESNVESNVDSTLESSGEPAPAERTEASAATEEDESVDAQFESNERAGQNTASDSSGLGGAFANVTNGRGDLWRRALFMVLFAVLYGVAEFVLWMVIVVQFLVVLFTGSANEQLLRLGSSLSIYSYQVFRFLTFTGDEQPFPMSAWPADEAEGSPWFDSDA